MIDRRSVQQRGVRRAFGEIASAADDSVRPSDLIRAQRARETAWTVFVDEDVQQPSQHRRDPRDSLVRRRPTEWKLVEDADESNKENVGYVVKRPRRRLLEPAIAHPRGDEGNDGDSRNIVTAVSAASPSTGEAHATPTSKNKGKRKLKTPPHDKTKTSKKQKRTKVEVHIEPAPPATPVAPEPPRRPLEDITHLFIDPTAFYFQPWRRASSVAVRASSVRIL